MTVGDPGEQNASGRVQDRRARPGRPKKATADAALRRNREQGLSFGQTARKHGVSKRTVGRRLAQAGPDL